MLRVCTRAYHNRVCLDSGGATYSRTGANTRWSRLAVRRPIGKVSSGRTVPGRKMQSEVIGGVHVLLKYRWFGRDLRRLRVCERRNGRYVHSVRCVTLAQAGG